MLEQIGWIVAIIVSFFAIVGLGRRILGALDIRPSFSGDELIFAVATGWLFIGITLFLIGIVHILYRDVILILEGLVLITGLAARPWELIPPARYLHSARAAWIPLLAILAILGISFVAALAPDVEFDSTWYHLPDAQRFMAEHAVIVHPVSIQDIAAFLPKLPELIFTWALAPIPGNPTLAQLYHWLAGALLTYATYRLSRRIGGSRGSALLAALSVVSSLSVLWLLRTAYVDLFVGLFGAAIALALIEASTAKKTRPILILAGLMAGALLFAKLQSIFFLPAVAVGAWCVRRRLTDILIVLGFAGIVVSPWYLLVWAQTGSPLGLSGYWPPGDVHYGGGKNFADWLIHVHPRAFLPRLLEVFVSRAPLFVFSAFAFLWWPTLTRLERTVLVTAFLAHIGWSYNPVPEDRYGLAEFPLLAAALSITFNRLNTFGKAVLSVAAAFVIIVNIFILLPIWCDRIPVGLSLEPRKTYFERHLAGNAWIYYDAANAVPSIVKNGKILFLSHNPYYVNVPATDLILFTHEQLSETPSANDVLQVLKAQQISHIITSRPYTIDQVITLLKVPTISAEAFRPHIVQVYRDGGDTTVFEVRP